MAAQQDGCTFAPHDGVTRTAVCCRNPYGVEMAAELAGVLADIAPRPILFVEQAHPRCFSDTVFEQARTPRTFAVVLGARPITCTTAPS